MYKALTKVFQNYRKIREVVPGAGGGARIRTEWYRGRTEMRSGRARSGHAARPVQSVPAAAGRTTQGHKPSRTQNLPPGADKSPKPGYLFFVVAVLGGRFPRVLLEKTPEVGLVGKPEPVGDLLHRKVGRLEHHLNLQHHRTVDELLGRTVRHAAHDGRQVTGRNAEFVGVKRHFALLGAMLVHESDETVEQLRLPRSRLRHAVLPGCETLHLVVTLQQQILQTVLDDRIAEHVAAVAVGVGRHLEPDRSPLDDPLGRMGDRTLAQGVEKRRVHPEGRLGKEIQRKRAVGRPEILRAVGEHEDRTGQQQHHRIAAHLPLVLVDGGVGAATATEENRTSFHTAGVIAEKGEIGFAHNKLLLGSGD